MADSSSPTSPSARPLAEGGKQAIAASRRPDDQAGPGRRPRRPRLREAREDEVEGGRVGPATPGSPRPPSRSRATPLPRRHLHPPPGLRHRQGLRRRRQDDPPLHHHRRRLRARTARTATSPPTSFPRAGTRRRTPARSTSTRRSTSSPRPTSSAATPAARSSTATAASSA